MFSAFLVLKQVISAKYIEISSQYIGTAANHRFVQNLLQQDGEAGSMSSLSSAQSLLSQLWDNFVYRLPLRLKSATFFEKKMLIFCL